MLQTFQRQREVGSAFGTRDRVDLVDDHVLDVAQDLAGLAREQQVQALGSRDEDVGRTACDLATVLAGRVAGPARDGDPRRLVAEFLRGQADPCERRSQVALHVVCQGLQRRDVEDPDVAGVLSCCRRAGVAGQAVKCVEEGGEGLATAGRSVDQRVIAPGDGGPAAGLGFGRGLEARFEPGPDGGREGCERIGDNGRGHGTAIIGAALRFDHLFHTGESRHPPPVPVPADRRSTFCVARVRAGRQIVSARPRVDRWSAQQAVVGSWCLTVNKHATSHPQSPDPYRKTLTDGQHAEGQSRGRSVR